MLKEMEKLEQERLKEEAEIKAALQKELKYNKYLEQQRVKLQEHQKQKVLETEKEKQQQAKKAKQERLERQKQLEEHEKKKKKIAEYKQKKLLTEELLANADLDGMSNDDYTPDDVMSLGSNEEEANAVMDQMIQQY